LTVWHYFYLNFAGDSESRATSAKVSSSFLLSFVFLRSTKKKGGGRKATEGNSRQPGCVAAAARLLVYSGRLVYGRPKTYTHTHTRVINLILSMVEEASAVTVAVAASFCTLQSIEAWSSSSRMSRVELCAAELLLLLLHATQRPTR